MVTKQFVGSGGIVPHIVPMRVLDENNKGDLYGLMCAMETARKNDIKVFNMSLGYYGSADSVFKAYLKRAIDNGVWIVTAAGNRTPTEPDTVNRNLDSMNPKFYPASFSGEPGFDKLLVATTVLLKPDREIMSSTRQNYDKKRVFGILADDVRNTTEGRFSLVTSTISGSQGWLIFGSSYATPVLTGRLARLLANNPSTSLTDLMGTMQRGDSGNQVKDNKYFPSHP